MKLVLSLSIIVLCLSFANAQNATLQETKLWIENYAGNLLSYSTETLHGEHEQHFIYDHSTSIYFEGETLVIDATSKCKMITYWRNSDGDYIRKEVPQIPGTKHIRSKVNPRNIYLTDYSIRQMRYEALGRLITMQCVKGSVTADRQWVCNGCTGEHSLFSINDLTFVAIHNDKDDTFNLTFEEGYKRVFNAIQALARFSGASPLPTVDPNKY